MGKNWDWSSQQGKEKRLEAEKLSHESGAPVPAKPPLHSLDGTMQDLFEKGWFGDTPVEIQRHIKPPAPLGSVLTENKRLRDLLGI